MGWLQRPTSRLASCESSSEALAGGWVASLGLPSPATAAAEGWSVMKDPALFSPCLAACRFCATGGQHEASTVRETARGSPFLPLAKAAGSVPRLERRWLTCIRTVEWPQHHARTRLRLDDITVLGGRRDPPCDIGLEVVEVADGHLWLGFVKVRAKARARLSVSLRLSRVCA